MPNKENGRSHHALDQSARRQSGQDNGQRTFTAASIARAVQIMDATVFLASDLAAHAAATQRASDACAATDAAAAAHLLWHASEALAESAQEARR